MAQVALPFNFWFYGSVYNNITINSDGVLSFTDVTFGTGSGCLPNASETEPFIAFYWDDMDPDEAGNDVRYHVVGSAPTSQRPVNRPKIVAKGLSRLCPS